MDNTGRMGGVWSVNGAGCGVIYFNSALDGKISSSEMIKGLNDCALIVR